MFPDGNSTIGRLFTDIVVGVIERNWTNAIMTITKEGLDLDIH